MRTIPWIRFLPICLVGVAVLFWGQACSTHKPDTESDAAVNLAVMAEPSSSFAVGEEALAALNDGFDPKNSQDRSHGAIFVWRMAGTHWVQYDWSRPISTDKIDVYWRADQRRVHSPQSCKLLYWDGKNFIPVHRPSGLGVEVDRYNTTTFEEVNTIRLRLEFDPDSDNAAGILEWKVYDSGNSPDLPPLVNAGVDRVVILGGQTYLSGTIKTLDRKGRRSLRIAWKQVSGPGKVTFEHADQPATQALFSQAGDYVLELKAKHGSLTGTASLQVKAELPPPPTPLEPVHTRKFKVNNPLWNQRIKALIVNWIPHCIDRISDPDLKEGGMNNIINAAAKLAGKPHGRHRGYVFSNAWVFNTIEAMCLALMFDSQDDREILAAQKKMQATLDDWIPKILAAQEQDGYFQTAFTLPRERAQDDTPLERWTRRGDHEGYVAGYFLEAGLAHHLATGGKDLRLYQAAKKLADCWYENIGPLPKKEWYDGHQAMEMALVRFGRYVDEVEGNGTGRKYIELAKFLLDCRKDGSKYDQSHVPVIQQYEAVGHAVRASYSYAAMADIAMETADIDYQSAVKSLWDNIVNRKYYVTGGIGSGESSEGFGPDYSLPNNAYCESCSSCGEIFFQHRMNRMYHEAQYADLYEETLYNALLGSIDLEGKNFYYQNSLEARGSRYDWHVCPCCVGNIPRTLLALPTWMYLKDADSIYVNLFIGSTVTVENVGGTDVEMVQNTDYPWSGKVVITVNPDIPAKFSVKIRIPDRDVSQLYTALPESEGISSILVNGSPIVPATERGYAVIAREWKKGDSISLELPQTVQKIKADDRIAANRGRVALRYGPLIYSLERIDQDIEQELLSDIPLTTQWRGELLGGVKVITGTWADGSPLMAIPYYTRANREIETRSQEAATSSVRRILPVSSRVWIKNK
jgi:DUF1680 family protein